MMELVKVILGMIEWVKSLRVGLCLLGQLHRFFN